MIKRRKYWKSSVVLLIAICISWGCYSCQTVSSHLRPDPSVLDRVLSGEALLGDRATLLELPEEDIFEITQDMRDFLNTHVPVTLSNYYKLERLIEVVTDKSQLGWDYDAFKTYNAAGTFYHKKGNCISYAILMVVLGRELGLDLQFNEVFIPPTWEMQDEHTVVLFRHVNVLAKVDGKQMVLGLNMEEYDSSFPQRTIPDIAGEAHYYNNRGTDFLNENDVEQAFIHFKKALTLQPEAAFLWGNMGVLYLRHDHYQEAEAAFLHAIELDPYEVTAISNLQRLYVKQGNSKLADYYSKEAEHSRMKNPYYRYYLAEKLLEDNQPGLALKHIKWAISRYKREHRFYFLAAKIYANLGKSNDAEKSLKRAAELAENENNRLMYESKISKLREISRKK